MNQRQVGVYKLFKLSKKHGSKEYDLETKELERKNHVVTTAYAERINASSKSNGLFYELDEKATNDYFENAGNSKKEFTSFEEVEEKGAINLADANKAKEAEKETLRAKYLELTGEEANKTYGVAKLTELVDAAQEAADAKAKEAENLEVK